MTSKEALYLLITNQKKVKDDFKFIDLNTHEKVSIEDCYDIVMKDLERLEKLEKVIETLKKSFLLSVGELRGIYFALAYDNNYVMTKEEYDLLKEVLENGKNYL